jgi:hypothetical protein
LPTSKRLPLPAADRVTPPALALTAAERHLVDRLRTPPAVQAWLNGLPYNAEKGGETLRGLRGVVRTGTAHCLEAALAAATILEQHGYPPLVLSFESEDRLDHVLYVYRSATGWGAIARSRDPGLHGRKPVFRSPRALALSYADPYVDTTGRVRGYAVVHLGAMDGYDWRLTTRNVWAVEQLLIDWPHHRVHTSDRRTAALRAWYAAYTARYGRKPVEYAGRERWSALPREYRYRDAPMPAPVSRDRSREAAW